MPFANWRSLLLERVTSHDELQVLLSLRGRAHCETTAEDLARELELGEAACTAALERLSAQGLAARVSDGRAFRFHPITVSLAREVDALEHAYRSSQLTVLQALSESAMQRVRASAARAFPEALRRRKPGE